MCVCMCIEWFFSHNIIYINIYTHAHPFFKSNFKLEESNNFVSCIWPMGYSYIHSLSKSQYINKTLVLMENFQLWTDAAHGVTESVGSLPWIFQSRNLIFPFLSSPSTHGNIITNALLKGTIFLPLPFLCPVLLELGGNEKWSCRRKLGRWK